MKFTKTRFMVAVMALVLVIPSVAVAVSPFVDVIPGKFYEAPVNWAAANNITTGKDATHFAPNDPVTRGESVTFLKRYNDNITQPGLTGLGTRIDDLGPTVGALSCASGQVAKFDGTNWACGIDIDTDTDTTIPNTDTLAALGCTTSQVARWDGTNWVCNTITLTSNIGIRSATTLDTTGNVGQYASIAIGADNLPIISYYDNTSKDLKAFHCTNTACTDGTATALDTAGTVGSDTSIAIGADNLPIISYHDVTHGDLKVAAVSVPVMGISFG